jgi:hypothetical protein
MTVFFEQLSDFLCIGGGGCQVLAVSGGGVCQERVTVNAYN